MLAYLVSAQVSAVAQAKEREIIYRRVNGIVFFRCEVHITCVSNCTFYFRIYDFMVRALNLALNSARSIKDPKAG